MDNQHTLHCMHAVHQCVIQNPVLSPACRRRCRVGLASLVNSLEICEGDRVVELLCSCHDWSWIGKVTTHDDCKDNHDHDAKWNPDQKQANDKQQRHDKVGVCQPTTWISGLQRKVKAATQKGRTTLRDIRVISKRLALLVQNKQVCAHTQNKNWWQANKTRHTQSQHTITHSTLNQNPSARKRRLGWVAYIASGL